MTKTKADKLAEARVILENVGICIKLEAVHHAVDRAVRIIEEIETSEKGTPSSIWSECGKEDPHGDRYNHERAKLSQGDMTDDQIANAMFMQPDINNLTAAKDRIRWLSRKLEATQQTEPEKPLSRTMESLKALNAFGEMNIAVIDENPIPTFEYTEDRQRASEWLDSLTCTWIKDASDWPIIEIIRKALQQPELEVVDPDRIMDWFARAEIYKIIAPSGFYSAFIKEFPKGVIATLPDGTFPKEKNNGRK